MFSIGKSGAGISEVNDQIKFKQNRVKTSGERLGRSEWIDKIVEELFNMETDREEGKDRLCMMIKEEWKEGISG